MKMKKNWLLVLLPLVATVTVISNATAQQNEKVIRQYFLGWEKKDWNVVRSTLADEFTFTSPAPDDHLSIDKFKTKCWPEAPHIKHVEFVRIEESNNDAFAILSITTPEGKLIRNVEYYRFRGDKILSIEVFFGGNGQGYPTNTVKP